MCFTQRSGNVLNFTIPSNAICNIIVVFKGTNNKNVNIDWNGTGTSATWDSCGSGVLPGTAYTKTFKNESLSPVSSQLSVLYENAACNGTTPTTAASNAEEIHCIDGGAIRVAAWTFFTPDDDDNAEITIIIDDNPTGA